jgi:hypothetical protein
MLTVLKPLPPTEAGMQGFPILVDLLKSIVRGWAAGLPIGLTDPATGANSYITLIGEQFTTRYYRPAVVSTMRSVLARCDLGADLWEQETA